MNMKIEEEESVGKIELEFGRRDGKGDVLGEKGGGFIVRKHRRVFE